MEAGPGRHRPKKLREEGSKYRLLDGADLSAQPNKVPRVSWHSFEDEEENVHRQPCSQVRSAGTGSSSQVVRACCVPDAELGYARPCGWEK
jgi:hypothetical protein